MTFFIQFSITGVLIGFVYSLVALAMVLIYKSSKVINFAQGQMVMLGAYISWAFGSGGISPVAGNDSWSYHLLAHWSGDTTLRAREIDGATIAFNRYGYYCHQRYSAGRTQSDLEPATPSIP
jgi:branched-subunit amino acid ABC-type transport system permease component